MEIGLHSHNYDGWIQKILILIFFFFCFSFTTLGFLSSLSSLWSSVWMLLSMFFPLGQRSLYRVPHTHFLIFCCLVFRGDLLVVHSHRYSAPLCLTTHTSSHMLSVLCKPAKLCWSPRYVSCETIVGRGGNPRSYV